MNGKNIRRGRNYYFKVYSKRKARSVYGHIHDGVSAGMLVKSLPNGKWLVDDLITDRFVEVLERDIVARC